MVKKKHALALFPLALCFSSAEVLAAATTTDLEKRLQEQERKILRLENQLKGTRSAVKENRGRIADMNERLKINGFMSAGVAQNDGDAMNLGFYGIEDNYSSAAVSKLGIQMTFAVTDQMDVTGQLVSKGTNDYQIEAEWAYLSYRVANDLTMRVGRQRIPYYLLSEYLDVGYAYPWTRPPIELYNIPISSTDGLGLLYDMSLGGWNFSLQAYAGAGGGFSEQLEGEFILQQAWGSALFAETDNWTFRVGYNRSHLDVGDVPIGGRGYLLGAGVDAFNEAATTVNGQVSALGLSVPFIENQANATNVKTEYKSAAFMYDDGSLLVMGEIANLAVKDFAFPAGDSGYFTVGYRFGKWMPHATFAKFYTDADADENIGNVTGSVQSLLSATFTGTYAATFQGQLGGGAPLPVAIAAAETAGDAAVANAIAQNGGGLMVLQNTYGSLQQQQQSYTVGVTYDINPRVKAKLDVTHYEDFGTFDSVGEFNGNPAALQAGQYGQVAVPVVSTVRGNGRFSVDSPGDGDKHTAIYSFSIDAVF